jgi:hypothetical protein
MSRHISESIRHRLESATKQAGREDPTGRVHELPFARRLDDSGLAASGCLNRAEVPLFYNERG